MNFRGSRSRSNSTSRHEDEVQDGPEEIRPEPQVVLEDEFPTTGVQVIPELETLREDPLGNILVDLVAAMSKLNYRLDDKQKIKEKDRKPILDVTGLVQQFSEHRNRNQSQVNELKEQLQPKVYCYNLAIEPPPESTFSPTDVLDSDSKKRKMYDSLVPKLLKKNDLFSGDKRGVNITEFLQGMNLVQSKLGLSKKEFADTLVRSTTGEPHTILYRMVHDLDNPKWHRPRELYRALLVMFDRSKTPEEAKLALENLLANKSHQLSTLYAYIEKLASRAALQFTAGHTRTTVMNHLSCKALIRALPKESSTMAEQAYFDLLVQDNEEPSLAKLVGHLTKYYRLINADIAANGGSTKTNKVVKTKPRAQTNAIRVTKNLKPKTNKPRPNNFKKFNNSKGTNVTKKSTPRRWFRPKGNNYNKTQSGGVQKHRTNTVYTAPKQMQTRSCTMNANKTPLGPGGTKTNNGKRMKSVNQINTRSNNAPSGMPGRYKFCSLCGGRSHSAADGCRHLFEDDGTVAKDVTPNFKPCGKCPKNLRKPLHHPERLCPFRASVANLFPQGLKSANLK